ncbi:MAG: helix-turn-helix domain-containing protein [Lactobacillus sp.]|nr:helix-turn-helix domain-containing protein [Lactobacillus sp.]
MSISLNLEFIKQRRKDLGFTQQEMAKAIGLAAPEKYSRRENGKYNFQVDELPVLAKKLKVPIKNLYL